MSDIKIFENRKIRTHWSEEIEDWYFSVVDVVSTLTERNYDESRKYWKVLKGRLKEEGSELVSFCYQLKLQAADGKMRSTDVLTTKGILRLIQSIPSKKAEPFKMWLAQIGGERLDEIADPEKAITRAVNYYKSKGYSDGWINQRLHAIEIRKELTDEWKNKGVTKDEDFAILTNELTKAWSGLTVSEYKNLKNLKKESLRDNMTNIELVINMLAEVTTTTLSKKDNPKTFGENKIIAIKGGNVANSAKCEYEKTTGVKVVSSINAKTKKLLDIKENK